MVRRAIKIASTPPCGPVYLCLPEDILDSEITEKIFPAHIPSYDTSPSADDLNQVIDMIKSSSNPIILAGDGVAWTHGVDQLIEFAEVLGAKVYSADGGEINFPDDHLLNYGSTGHMFGSASLDITKNCDLCIALGCYLLPEVFPDLGDIFNDDTKIVHIDTNVNNIAKNHRVDVSYVSRPGSVINTLLPLVKALPAEWHNLSQMRRTKSEAKSPVINNRVDELYGIPDDLNNPNIDGKSVLMRSGPFIKRLSEKVSKDVIVLMKR
jgi:benzoylformate decarboxylase